MKNTGKIIAISASIILAVGILLATLGLALGGATSAYIDAKGIHFDTNNRYQKTMNFKEITDLNISTEFSEVEIVKADYNRVKIDVNERFEPKVEVDNGKLTVKTSGNKLKFSISLFNFKVPESKITIYLKDPSKLNNVVLKQSFGEIKTTELNAKNLQMKNHFGDMKVKGTFEEINSQTNFGSIKIDTKKVEYLDASTNFGETKITIDDNKSNYQIDQNSQFGDIEIVGDKIKNDSSEYNRMDLKTNFGDIKVWFTK